MFILLKDKKLARQFQKGEVSEKEALRYLMAFCFFTAIAGTSFMTAGTPAPNLYDLMLDFLVLALALGTPALCYAINRKGDGRDFLNRYIGLSIPISIQVFLITFVVGFVYGFVSHSEDISYEDAMVAGPFMVGAAGLSYLYMVWRYVVTFRIAASVAKDGAGNV